jgi:methylthioribulose-1-phosphate dehydratase
MSQQTSPRTTDLPALHGQVAEIIHFLHAQGWTPATSSNFSCRTNANSDEFSISISGLDKGQFKADDFLSVNFEGKVTDPAKSHLRPSAETRLHSVVYQCFPDTLTVLHTHSIHGTVLSKLYEPAGGIWLKQFEILKAFEGINTHDCALWLPIFPNAQDMETLSSQVKQELQRHSPVHGFMLAGHGLYTWGQTPAQAKRHVEAFEYLFDCILKLRSYGYADYSG